MTYSPLSTFLKQNSRDQKNTMKIVIKLEMTYFHRYQIPRENTGAYLFIWDIAVLIDFISPLVNHSYFVDEQ